MRITPGEPILPAPDTFREATLGAFEFLSSYGFVDGPLAQHAVVNPFQLRFSNGKLVIVVEAINSGRATAVHLEDLRGTEVPLVLFGPPEFRKPRRVRRVDHDLLTQLQLEAQQLRDHCMDLLQGDMTRFHNRVAEWRRIMNRDRSYQKGDLR